MLGNVLNDSSPSEADVSLDDLVNQLDVKYLPSLHTYLFHKCLILTL